MSRNHRNRSWRAQWVRTADTAIHKSGITARLTADDSVMMEGTDKIDSLRWDLAKLLHQAEKIFRP